MNVSQLKDFASKAKKLIDDGAAEDKLRHFLSSRLVSIFPESPWWVEAHMQGTEEHVHFSTSQGPRDGFVDAVVGKTAIEYEKNLAIQSIYDEGYHQVKEYSAALCNMGIPETEVLGVLSDTVRWYGYNIHIIDKPLNGLLGPDNIVLNQVTFVDLSIGTDDEFSRFEQFVEMFMARVGSRFVNANTLVMDFGIDSSFYREYIGTFSQTVYQAMEEKPNYANLIKQIWQNFIAYLGVSDYGAFSIDTYVNEYYLVTIAKIFCANILIGKANILSQKEIKKILNGEYFLQQNIENLVDYDYFGWLNDSPYIDLIVPAVKEMQRRLVAYDFSCLSEQDIFGRLLAQLASREHRLMLGQEFTPHWIAKDIVKHCIEEIKDQTPRILDMCCGSGVFLIEAIKAIRKNYSISLEDYSEKKDAIIFSAVMGFDIDPLAIMLAKVNWIMAMRDIFKVHKGSITIPIYHADSLFVATPITHRMPAQDEDYYLLTLNHQQVKLPVYLLSPSNRKVFDSFVSKVYHLAMKRSKSNTGDVLNPMEGQMLINAIEKETGVLFESDKKTELTDAAMQLICLLETLQRQGQNGIWHFIFSNNYRPGLTEHQFNCIVSNPPWMAMSKLAENPYRNALKEISRRYGIQPVGAAHPHMELATIFLVSSIDRYLKDGAQWSCIMPSSIMTGLNHEAFRKERYQLSNAKLTTKIDAIWELPADTFKNKAIVLSGKKNNTAPPHIKGRVYEKPRQYIECVYTLNHQGKRSAWTNKGANVNVEDVIATESIPFTEGCDLFPRTALFHNFTKNPNKTWDISPIDRDSDNWYLISDIKKKICNELTAENFDDEFIYDTFISKHLSPFFMSNPAKVLIPGKKNQNDWIPLSPADLALMNTSTAHVFQQISEAVDQNLMQYLSNTINIYGKLYRQDFTGGDFLVLSSASGSNPCAAYINLREYNRSRLIIDQTLYWHLSNSEDEAVYITGLLNSTALKESIADFQPEGAFGARHIHKLPYKIIPQFDPDNELHQEMVKVTKTLIKEWNNICNETLFKNLLSPNSGTLNSRRRRQQERLKNLTGYSTYDAACSCVLI